MDIFKIISNLQAHSEEMITYKLGSDFASAVTAAVELLIRQGERIAELDAEVRWIPVAEGVPEEHNSVVPGLGTVSKPVLVTWVDPNSAHEYPEDRFVREGITRNGEFTLSHINGDLIPIAWKSLPAPAKGDAK